MSDFLPVFSYEDDEQEVSASKDGEDEQPLQQRVTEPSHEDKPAAQQALQQEPPDSESSSSSVQRIVAHNTDGKQDSGRSTHDRPQEKLAHPTSAASPEVPRGSARGRGRGRRAGSAPGRGTPSARSTRAPSELHAGAEVGGDLEPSVEGRVVEVNGEPKLLPGVSMEASLEARRRMAAFQAMLLLLEHGAGGEAELAQRAAPLSGDELMQVAEERSLAGKCGNPRCAAPPLSAQQQAKGKGSRQKGAQHSSRRFMASADRVTVLGVEGEEGHRFCGSACHAYIAAHAAMLGDPLQRLKANARNLMPSHAPRSGRPGSSDSRDTANEAPEVAAQVNGVTTMLANIREREQHDQSAQQQLAVAHARLGAAAAALGGNFGRAGAVEGYVPGTRRVGMAATAAAAAARKAAAAGESAYQAAAAAAAKSDASEGTVGGGGGGSSAQSTEHVRPTENGVQDTGAELDKGGMPDSKAVQGVKHVHFAEHNNFKYVYDVNAPCRPCPEHCVPVFQFTLGPDTDGSKGPGSKAAQKRAKASHASSSDTIAMVGLLGAAEGGWAAAGQAGKEGALGAEKAARLHAEQEAEWAAAALRLARERRGGGSKKEEKAERKAQKRLLKGKGKGKGKGRQGKNKKGVEEENEDQERVDGGSDGETSAGGEVVATDADSSEVVVEASGAAAQPVLPNLCVELPPLSHLQQQVQAQPEHLDEQQQQQQQQIEQRQQEQTQPEHQHPDEQLRLDEQQQEQQQQLQVEQEQLLQHRPPSAEARAQDEAIMARIKQVMQERQWRQQQQQTEESRHQDELQQQTGESQYQEQQQQQQQQKIEQQQQQQQQQQEQEQQQQPPTPVSPSRQEPPVRRFRPNFGLQQAAKGNRKVIMLDAPPRRTSAPTNRPPSTPTSRPSSTPTSRPPSAPTSRPLSTSSTPLANGHAPASPPRQPPSRTPSTPTSRPTSALTSKPSFSDSTLLANGHAPASPPHSQPKYTSQQAASSQNPRAPPLAWQFQPQAIQADDAPYHSTYSVSAEPHSRIVCQDAPLSNASGNPVQSSSIDSSTSSSSSSKSNALSSSTSRSSSTGTNPAATDSKNTSNRGRRRAQPLARVTPPHFATPCIVEEEPFGDAPPAAAAAAAAAAEQGAGLQAGGGPVSTASCTRPHVVRLKSQEVLRREQEMQKELDAIKALQRGVDGDTSLGLRNGGKGEDSEERDTDSEEEQQQHNGQGGEEGEGEEEEEEWTDEDGEFGGSVHEPSWRGQGKQQQGRERSRGDRGVVGNDSSRECSDDDGDSEGSEAEDKGPGLRFELSSSDEEEGSDREGKGGDDAHEAHRAAAPFFGPPPKAFRVELSPFNFVWSLLSAWITRDTISYLASPTEPPIRPAAKQSLSSEPQQQQQQQAGSKAQQQPATEERARAMLAACKDEAEGSGKEQDTTSQPTLSTQGMQAHAALASRLEPHVHGILRTLHARVPEQEVSKRITHVLCTFVFPGPIPNLSITQWQLLALALLRALAMGRMPALAAAFEGPDAGSNVRAVLRGEAGEVEQGFGLPHLSALVDLLLHA